MPLTATESSVLDLWDAGHGTRRIVKQTGLRPARVTEVLNLYHVRSDSTHRRNMAHASAQLRAAILAQTATMGGRA